MENNPGWAQKLAFAISVFVIVLIIIGAAISWRQRFYAEWQIEIFRKNYAAIVGLPFVAGAAFIVVTFFRQVAGPIRIKVANLEIERRGRSDASVGSVLPGDGLLNLVCYGELGG